MYKLAVIAVSVFCVAIAAVALDREGPASAQTPTEIAAHILNVASEALRKDDNGPSWQELESRLGRLYDDPSKEADEAVVILMSFSLGAHNGEELYENLLSRGPRMIPILERYLREQPASLLGRYPQRVRRKRTTTVMFLNESLEILTFKSGARHISAVSVKTAPLRQQARDCRVKLVQQPELRFGDNLVQPGESYETPPVLRAKIEETGAVTNAQLLAPSGIKRLDSFLLDNVHRWKYMPRRHCGMVEANIVVYVHWAAR